jgi:hypothetical protein
LGASPSSSSSAERRLVWTAGEGAREFSCILGERRPPATGLLEGSRLALALVSSAAVGGERCSANGGSLGGGGRRPWFEIIVVVA